MTFSRLARVSRLSASLTSAGRFRPARAALALGRRSFAQAATASAAKTKMFCFQCEQTEHQTGCTTIGVCGKTSETAGLQDVLLSYLKVISTYASKAQALDAKAVDPVVDRFVIQALFSTVTNVNFDSDRIHQYIVQADQMQLRAKQLYSDACASKHVKPEAVKVSWAPQSNWRSNDKNGLMNLASSVGIQTRKAAVGDDLVGWQEMAMYGLKGVAAYFEHSQCLDSTDPTVFVDIHKAIATLANDSQDESSQIANCLFVGDIALRTLAALNAGHVAKYGVPTPARVQSTPQVGKCILVSGHDMVDLEHILQQTEGKNINVYTHGEMLPAHGYPGLKKYKHLVGHYGGPWQLQKMEFAQFPGAIIMTTNCLIEPMKSYKNRIFTRSVVGWPGVKHLDSHDFSEVVKAAQAAEGFVQEDLPATPQFLTTGFGHQAILGVADKVVAGVKSGAIKRFFVIGGCDGSEGERSYFTDLATSLPKDTVILTLGCGKYRFNRLNLGDIGGIPRVLDVGQCNDAYSAVQVAVALANVFKTDVNSLPLSFAVSWFEQKAVAVLLMLLKLGIKNIRLGPHLPGFVTPKNLNTLVAAFDIKPTLNVKEDMPKMMQGK